jgi:hypothetical protein
MHPAVLEGGWPKEEWMATNEGRIDVPRDDEFRTADEGGDMRGPYGGAGDYGGSYTAGGWAGAGFGGGYAGYGPDTLYGGYAGVYGHDYGLGAGYPGYPGRGPVTGVSAGMAFSPANIVNTGYDRDMPVPVPGYELRRNFTGRGPRGYRRSDARIHEDICEVLTRHPEIDASDIDVEVQNGVVTLSGTVEDRYTKRLAEDVAELTLGVHDVENRMRIA